MKKSEERKMRNEALDKRRELIKKRITELWNKGFKKYEISKETGIPESTVRNVLSEVEC